jgi:hypothetical protein
MAYPLISVLCESNEHYITILHTGDVSSSMTPEELQLGVTCMNLHW